MGDLSGNSPGSGKTPPVLEARGLSYSYPDGSPALSGVSFSLARGERLALIGANGSGKSTLLMLLSGCFKPSGGQILIGGEPVRDVKELREATGMIFQDPDNQLFMPSVLEDVMFGLKARKVPDEEARERAMECLETLGVAHKAGRPPHRMSGGEKRLAALAGILVMRPNVVLLDEPTSFLDPRARREIVKVLRALDGPMVMATHNFGLARELCGRAIILYKGEVRAEGATLDVLANEGGLERFGL